MKTQTVDVDRARATDIIALARSKGLNIQKSSNGRFSACCPFHSERTPSFYLHTSGPHSNRFHCYGCGANGDSIALLMQLDNIGFIDAVKQLAGNTEGYKPAAYLPPLPAEPKRETIGEFRGLYADFLKWCKETPGQLKREALEYLNGRGISNEAIKAGRLFVVPDYDKAREYLRGVGMVKSKAAGLLNEKGNFVLYQSPILFPCYSPQGEPFNIIGRRIGNPSDNYPKYRNLSGVPRYPYGAFSLSRKGKIYLVEGPIDALSGIALTGSPFLALSGLNPPECLYDLVRGRESVLLLDNDKAGNDAFTKVANRFVSKGIRITRGTMKGNHKDLGELFALPELPNVAAENANAKHTLETSEPITANITGPSTPKLEPSESKGKPVFSLADVRLLYGSVLYSMP